MSFWIRDKQEVEVVDFLIQVKESIVSLPATILSPFLTAIHISLHHTHTQATALKHYPTIPGPTLQTLQAQLKSVLDKLPEDLQSCLRATFSHVL